MPDIVIYRGKYHGKRYLFPETEKGINFIRANMAYESPGHGNYYVAVDASHIEEIIKLLEENELHVEESRDTKNI